MTVRKFVNFYTRQENSPSDSRVQESMQALVKAAETPVQQLGREHPLLPRILIGLRSLIGSERVDMIGGGHLISHKSGDSSLWGDWGTGHLSRYAGIAISTAISVESARIHPFRGRARDALWAQCKIQEGVAIRSCRIADHRV